jgi:hypothetical protein
VYRRPRISRRPRVYRYPRVYRGPFVYRRPLVYRRPQRRVRVFGCQASRSAVAVGPPGRMMPEQLAPGAGLEVNQAAEVDPVAGAGGARTTVSRRPAARIEGDCYSLSEAWQQQARLIG